MSRNTHTVLYFDWKTVMYIYVCGKCHTQFMLPMEKSVTFTGACANEIVPPINRSFVYEGKEGRHVRIVVDRLLHLYQLHVACQGNNLLVKRPLLIGMKYFHEIISKRLTDYNL
jgi:hypothetical protein